MRYMSLVGGVHFRRGHAEVTCRLLPQCSQARLELGGCHGTVSGEKGTVRVSAQVRHGDEVSTCGQT